MTKSYKRAVAIMASSFLLACSDDEIIPAAPSITLAGGTYSEGSTVTLSADVFSQADISSYQWQVISGGAEIIDSGQKNIEFVAPDVDQDSTSSTTLRLTVIDEFDQVSTKDVTLDFTSVQATIAFASLMVDEKDTATFSASVDAMDQEIVSATWSQISGPSAEFSDNGDYSIDIVAPETTADESIVFELSLTDSDGDIVTETGTVDVNQLTIPITVSGIATDSPISNGIITVQINGRDFDVTATADASGLYTIDLAFDDSDFDSVITLTAQGVDTQANAGLISMLGTVTDLVTAAGDDGVIDQTESNAVKITNLSTAEYALAKLANGGEDFTSVEDYQNTLSSINYTEVITLATAIKVAIDKSADNAALGLPDGIDNTLELTEDAQALTAYVEYVNSTPEFEAAKQEMLADSNLIDSTNWALDSVYYHRPPALARTAALKLDSDSFTMGSASGPWQFEENQLVLDWVIAESDLYDQNTGGFVTVECINCLQRYTITRLNSNDTGETWNVMVTGSYSYEAPYEEHNREFEISEVWPMVPKSLTSAIDISEATTVMLPIDYSFARANLWQADPGYNTSGDRFNFNADGTGSLAHSGYNFTWSQEGDYIDVNFNGNILRVESADIKNQHFATTWLNAPTSVDMQTLVGVGVITSEVSTFNDSIVPGYYTYDRSLFSNSNAGSSHFWFEFEDDGTGQIVNTYDANGDGTITADEASYSPLTWIIENGLLKMHYTQSGLPYIRQWDLGQIIGNRYLVVQHNSYPDYPGYEVTDVREVIKIEQPPVTF